MRELIIKWMKRRLIIVKWKKNKIRIEKDDKIIYYELNKEE